MANGRGRPSDETAPRWRVFRSDTGRWWATREDPFDQTQQAAGAARTVDADDELALARAMAEQEASPSSR
ncbi:hypothetical protein [Sphaerisporangium aureirubrum]|uniref:DUF2188 domain-containing protein n=1 Tax=Sphaerisporangium aureirubrum TaxID=1544736 RepID=A0ABW1NTU1_9ACTN